MTPHDRSIPGLIKQLFPRLPRVSLLLLSIALAHAEETRDGSDVAELLLEAKKGEVDAVVEVAEHFLGNPTSFDDGEVPRDFPQLEKWLQAASGKGSAEAALLLGWLYQADHEGVPRNETKALAFYEKAARAGSERAMLNLASHHLHAENSPPDLVKAEAWLRNVLAKAKADTPIHIEALTMLDSIAFQREAAAARDALVKRADAGDREAQYELASSLFNEATDHEDSAKADEAMRRLTEAAKAGFAAAQYDLFYKLYPADPKAARPWMQKAVAQKHGPALAKEGLNYLVGRDDIPIPCDPAKGIELILQAVQAGSTTVASGLVRGDYFPGMTETDASFLRYAKNPEWLATLTAAAERGEARAQYWLGHSLELTDGPASTTWFAKAAAQGHPRAMMHLSLAYHNGSGMPRDLTQAYFWLTRAALLTDPEAQWRLAEAHRKGIGTTADAGLARYWISLSANNLPDNSTSKDYVKKSAAEMTAPMPTRDAVWANALAAHAQARLPGEAPAAPAAVAAIPPASPAQPAQPAAPKTLTLDEHRTAAAAGNAESMYQLGLADLDRRRIWSDTLGGVVPVDRQRDANDFRWIMSAAQAGHPEAQFLAATHWFSAETDAAKKSWLEKAASQGHAAAKERLAVNTKEAASAATRAVELAKRTVTDRELAAKGDGDAAMRLIRDRIKLMASTIVSDFTAAQSGQPTSGKNYQLGQLDPEMTLWMDTAVSCAQLDSLTLLHSYLRDEQPETAYLLLLFRERLARIESRLALSDIGFGMNSRAGVEKALAFLREKLTSDQRARAERIANDQWSGSWLDNRLGQNFELGICGFPKDHGLASAYYRRAGEAGFSVGQVNLARCYELGLGVAKDPDQARAWSAKAAAQGTQNEPTAYRISASIKRKIEPVAAVQSAPPAKVDELDLLKSNAGNLQGRTVAYAGKVYQVPQKIYIATLDDEITLTAIGAQFSYSSYYSRNMFGTRILTGVTTRVKVRDLIRYIENVSGAYIVTEIGPCKSCSGEGSSWDNQSRTRTGCRNCSSTGCVPTFILNNGSSRPF